MQSNHSRTPWFTAFLFAAAMAQMFSGYAATKLFGVVYNEAADSEGLTAISPGTAVATPIGTAIPGCCSVSGSSTLGAGGVLYFVGKKTSEPDPRLFMLDTKTGTVLSSPVIPASYYLDFIEYDAGTGRLLGFIYDYSTSTESLATINPATAAATPIGPGVSQCCAVWSAPTLNRASGIIYLLGKRYTESSARLFGFNASTGAVQSEPYISDTIELDFLEYDAGTSRLLGFIYDSATQTEKFATINPSTAAVTPVGVGIAQCCGVSTAPALDRSSGIIYLAGRIFTESSPRLFGFNSQTGAMVSNPAISSSIYLDFLEASYGAAPFGDIDGDGKTDIAVWRPNTRVWYALRSSSPTSYTAVQWGLSDDTAVAGDYDGDMKMDIAVWRKSTGYWYILRSGTPGGYSSVMWGMNGDIPVPADYDGDGKTDIAVWRPSTRVWYVQLSGTPGTYRAIQWGLITDIPTPGDYDGDGKTDIAVWRGSTGTWYILKSSVQGAFTSTVWGANGDFPVPGDYDGDAKADLAVWRPGTRVWYILLSGSPGGYTARQWGANGDTPVSGDYDGDGKADIGVWRPSTGIWYILSSGSPGSYTARQWGSQGDIPISSLTGIADAIP